MSALKRSSTPKRPRPAKRIRPMAGDASADCQEQFNIQVGLRTTVPQSPKFTVNPAVATTFTAWSATTDKAQASYRSIIALQSTLEQTYTSLGALMLQYGIDRDAFLVAVSSVCENDEDARAFGLSARSRQSRAAAGVPVDLRFVFGDVVGELAVRWPPIPGAAAYIAEQSSGDPALQANWTQCYAGTAAFFKITGLTLGQKLWFRVRSIGKGLSAWSEPSDVTAR